MRTQHPNRPLPSIKFADFAEKWLDGLLMFQKRSSQSTVRSHFRAHLLPAFGDMNMADIRMELIQRFVADSTKSPKTIKNLIITLRSMWNAALAWEYVQHNPFQRNASGRLLLKLPAQLPSTSYSFTVEECLHIIDKAEGRWKLFFRIMGETGMRPGELAGLRRDAIGENTLSVTQSVWGQRVQTPKSRAGVRTLAISNALTTDLRNMVASTPDNQYGLMFVTARWRNHANQPKRMRVNQNDGERPLSMDNFRQRVLNPILVEIGLRGHTDRSGQWIPGKLDKLGIKRCGAYAFRHMNATLMDRLNAPMKTRQKRLGHAQIETTLTHYTHHVDADDVAVAERIGAILSPNGEQSAISGAVAEPEILSHPAVRAEIARQVALALKKR